jgi:2-polyprenyl-3-methyl-5-hydroxy-6-metoxy-1,4-benzoquinol methylase
MVDQNMLNTRVCHERSYSKRYLGGLVHRTRLRSFVKILRKHIDTRGGMVDLGDFGCSNGFIIESIAKKEHMQFKSIIGLDYKLQLLEDGKRKQIPNALFEHYDLNEAPSSPMNFQLVTCLETLEHIQDYRHGLKHLYHHLAEGGILVISVPNEMGAPGFVKYLGRYLARRNPYEDFFDDKSRLSYIWNVVTGGDIERFRDASRKGYGPHLGFDYRKLDRYINSEYVRPGLLIPIEKRMTMLGMNVFAVFQRYRPVP